MNLQLNFLEEAIEVKKVKKAKCYVCKRVIKNEKCFVINRKYFFGLITEDQYAHIDCILDSIKRNEPLKIFFYASEPLTEKCPYCGEDLNLDDVYLLLSVSFSFQIHKTCLLIFLYKKAGLEIPKDIMDKYMMLVL